jgi:hypothetical protein
MMRILHSSFDFLFVFVLVVIAHVGLCDLCDWDARALAIGASLLWIHCHAGSCDYLHTEWQ